MSGEAQKMFARETGKSYRASNIRGCRAAMHDHRHVKTACNRDLTILFSTRERVAALKIAGSLKPNFESRGEIHKALTS